MILQGTELYQRTMPKSFHRRTGTMVTLSNSNKTAHRNHPLQEFNNGLVMSNDPLIDDELFEVRIERKVPTWSGSIEIGVTSLDPSILDFPSSAMGLRESSWVMSGTSVLENGSSHLEGYGDDLDALSEGEQVGVMRTSCGELHFYVNGVDQGVAATGVTGVIYAAIDLYGKCTQVSVVDPSALKKPIAIGVEDQLHFHDHCGTMVRLTHGNRTAERKEPVDEFNNGVVMTYRPLKDDELFEIRIDKLVSKWSGSIEMGITTHNPDTLDFPATMTNMRSGTIMMSGCGILTNGKGSRREYGEYNLDELHEGDRIGLIKMSNKNLHYYINGLDQGMAAENVPEVVFGVVDLYGMTVKVSITDYSRPTVNEQIAHSNSFFLEVPNKISVLRNIEDELLFHEHCGVHVSVCNGGLTALRPNCLDRFNNAVVITNRPLFPGELFEVLLEQVVMKWEGTIEIGVTTHSALVLDFPSTMTNVRSGTWMMTGNGVMYNGSTIADEYGRNLDKLKVGDKVGVVVYEDGKLHFFVNGVDQGLAASNVPNGVYGVIDLYGQAAKASIVRNTSTPTLYEDANASATEFDSDQCMSRASSMAMDLRSAQAGKIETEHINEVARPKANNIDRNSLYLDNDDFMEPISNDVIFEPAHVFHPICGTNIILDPCNVTATRTGDYCHGTVFSAKLLENDDMFEVQIFTTNSGWVGSLMLGVTTFTPDNQMGLPDSAMDLTGCDSWLLVGSQIFKNGTSIKKNYAPCYARITAGDKVGVKVFNDDSLHFFLNGVDLGTAATHMPKKLRAIADVFGSVESITICNVSHPLMKKSASKIAESVSFPISTSNVSPTSQLTFHLNHGRNIQLTNDNLSASRIASYNQGVTMSNRPLQLDELFQVRIDSLNSSWTGSIHVGVSNQNPDLICLPLTSLSMRRSTWMICGESVFYNGIKVRSKYGPNLDSLKSSYIVGVKIDQNKCLHLLVNGIDQGVAADRIDNPAFAIIDVYGQCCQVTVTNEDYSSDSEPEKDDKEKADIENNDGKEKDLKPGCSRLSPHRNCEHQNVCEKVKSLLGLNESLFVPENIKCFCETCHKLRGDEPYFKKGDPPKEFAQPFGWCRFPLKTTLKMEKSGIHEKWHVAFQGISFQSVRKILDKGKLLPPEMLGFKIQSDKSAKVQNSKETHSCHVLISPTMRYAGSSKFCATEEYMDSNTKKIYHARIAFQVYVRPGSYTVGPQQLGIRDPVDVQFSNNDLEWYTKEEGSIILQGLLIRVDGV